MKRVVPSLRATLSPLYVFEAVRPTHVQTALRQVFEHWGLPERLRIDNGQPWGSANDLPRDLALWLIGLGIEVIWNRPYRPQDNGRVERSHGVTKNWIEPHTCHDLVQLQQRLNRAVYLQRTAYPYHQGLSRTQYFPALQHGGQPYQQASEPQQWQLARVDALLAQGVWVRHTDSDGKISIYGRNYSVGRRYSRQAVLLRFDPETRHWQAYDTQGHCLRAMANRELSSDSIVTLQVTRHKPRKPSKTTGKT